MKILRYGLMTSVALGGLLLVPAAPSEAHLDDPADVGELECVSRAAAVKTVTFVANSQNGEGMYGFIDIAGTPFVSSVSCTGVFEGTGTYEGVFGWCNQLSTNHGTGGPGSTFDCNGHTSKVTADEAQWTGASDSHSFVRARMVLNGGAILCDVQGDGHSNVTSGAVTEASVVCNNGSSFTGYSRALAGVVLGPAGDQFAANPSTLDETGNLHNELNSDANKCANYNPGPNEPGNIGTPFVPGAGHADCFRALFFNGRLHLHQT